MWIERVNNSTNFTGKIIYSEFMTPEVEKFKCFAHERISKIIEDEPFDIYVKSRKTGDKVAVGIKPAGKEKELNFFMLYSLYDAIKSAKDKMLLDEVQEFMSKAIEPVIEELQIRESVKQNKFIPKVIGRNSEISSRSKFNKNGAKYIKRG